jgi:hypothetical protein
VQPNLVLPKPDYLKAACCHVGVLAPVQLHPPYLASVGRWEACGVAVPVVPIELDDNAKLRVERINAESPANQVLRGILHSDAVKHAIPSSLQPIGAHRRLPLVHFTQHHRPLRVGVPARRSAIGRVRLLLSRGRPAELGAACFAPVCDLAPALPKIAASLAAALWRAPCRGVKVAATLLADVNAPGPAFRLRLGRVASMAAKLLVRPRVPSNKLPAAGTIKRPNLVSENAFHAGYSSGYLMPSLAGAA